MSANIGLSTWRAYGVELGSRFLLGTAGYPSPQILCDAIANAAGGHGATASANASISRHPNCHIAERMRVTRIVAQMQDRMRPTKFRRPGTFTVPVSPLPAPKVARGI